MLMLQIEKLYIVFNASSVQEISFGQLSVSMSDLQTLGVSKQNRLKTTSAITLADALVDTEPFHIWEVLLCLTKVINITIYIHSL